MITIPPAPARGRQSAPHTGKQREGCCCYTRSTPAHWRLRLGSITRCRPSTVCTASLPSLICPRSHTSRIARSVSSPPALEDPLPVNKGSLPRLAAALRRSSSGKNPRPTVFISSSSPNLTPSQIWDDFFFLGVGGTFSLSPGRGSPLGWSRSVNVKLTRVGDGVWGRAASG